MTIDEAKEVIEQDIPCELDADLIEALHMALASLEAWEKVKQEIDEQYDRVHSYNVSCAEGLEMALGIIDKHLQEASPTGAEGSE